MVKINEERTTLARAIAPEDIAPGQFITPLHETVEYVCICFDSAIDKPPRRVRVHLLPDDGEAGMPLKVLAVSLPFVFVKDANGERRTMDVRRFSFARLPKSFARSVWAEVKAQRKRQAKRAKCK